jgi:hypothetical protein
MSTIKDGAIEIAASNGFAFANASVDDLLIRATDISQHILIGMTGPGSTSILNISNSNVDVNGDIVCNGIVGTTNRTDNCMLSLYNNNAVISPTDTNYYGFGVNNSLFRYQVTTAGNHAFFSDTKELMRITNAGNIGIGTTTPGYEIDIFSSNLDTTQLNIKNNNTTSGSAGIQLSAHSNNFTVRVTPQRDVIQTNSGNGNFTWMNSTTELVRLSTSGNLGIGTTLPVHKLDVNGTINATGYSNLPVASTAASGIVQLMNSTSNTSLTTAATANAVNNLRLNTLSNVTVNGTTLNIFKGDGSAPITFTGGGSTFAFSNATQNNNDLVLTKADNRTFTYTPSITNSAGTQIYGVASDSATAPSFTWTGDTNTGMFTPGVDTVAITTGGTERLRIDSAGEVGIGTTSPSSLLHISGSGPTSLIQNTSSAVNAQLRFTNNIGNTCAEVGIFQYSNLFVANKQTGNMTFETSGVERVRIDSSGNVGIGMTASNGCRIDIKDGDLRVTGDSVIKRPNTGITSTLFFNNSNDSEIASIAPIAGTGWNATGTLENDLVIRVNQRGSRIHIGNQFNGPVVSGIFVNSNNNVGINTTSPLFTLDVNGTIDATTYNNLNTQTYLIAMSNAAYATSNTLYTGAATNTIAISASNRAFASLSNAAINNNGLNITRGDGSVVSYTPLFTGCNVGYTAVRFTRNINTNVSTLPTSAYTITSQILAADDTVTTPTYSYTGDATTGIYRPATGNIAITTGGTERMRVDSSGNVGIGLTTATQRLHVSGNMLASGIIATTSRTDNCMLCLWSPGSTYSATTTQYYGFGVNGNTFRYQVDGTNSSHVFFADATELMRVTGGGNVGIGTTAPSQKLHVIGNILASQDITAFSDSNFKYGLSNITGALEKVQQLNGYTYYRTDEADKVRHAGLIAQEVQNVLPEVVHSDDKGTLSIAYGNMAAMFVEAIKEIKAVYDAKMQAYDAKMQALEARLTEIAACENK